MSVVLGCVAVAQSATAAGIDGYVTVRNPMNRPIVLNDKYQQKHVLQSGRYDARLSNLSSDMTLTNKMTGEEISMAVPNGFPRGDLRNFILQGFEIGQAYNFMGVTQDQVLGPVQVQYSQMSCRVYDTYRCGSYGCPGHQSVEERYQSVDRVFTLTMTDIMTSENVGDFRGVVETNRQLVSSYPIGACIADYYPYPSPYPRPDPYPYPYPRPDPYPYPRPNPYPYPQPHPGPHPAPQPRPIPHPPHGF